MDQILSQDEIDALLNAVEEGAVDFESNAPASQAIGPVISCDLTRQERVIRGRMTALEMINDRLCRFFRMTMSNQLRRVVEFVSESTRLVKFGELLHSVSAPSCINLYRFRPLNGMCMIVVDPQLIFDLLDIVFGGIASRVVPLTAGRDFTTIEVSFIKKFLAKFTSDLATAWNPVVEIDPEYVVTEVNPAFVAIHASTDVVINTTYEFRSEGVSGTIRVIIPYSAIEPFKQQLGSGIQIEKGDSEKWQTRIWEDVSDTPIELAVELGQTSMNLQDVIDLEIGDVIQLDKKPGEPLVGLFHGVPKLKVLPLVKDGGIGLTVNELIFSDLQEEEKAKSRKTVHARLQQRRANNSRT